MERFEYNFEDESQKNTLSFDYDDSVDEKMKIVIEDDVPTIYADRAGLLCLAKTLIKMALCNYNEGFHVHLRDDFDGENSESLRIVLNNIQNP